MSVNKPASKLMVDTPLSTIRDIYSFFHTPANTCRFKLPAIKHTTPGKTWGSFTPNRCYATDRSVNYRNTLTRTSARSPSHGRGTRKKASISISIRATWTPFWSGLHQGKVVYERYKTMRPFDKHNLFSSGKVIAGTMVALLEYEGKVDVKKPVSDYVPQLKGSDWDKVTVEETLDMATGLDSTEHEEPNDDARVNPAHGWYEWAVSIGLFRIRIT